MARADLITAAAVLAALALAGCDGKYVDRRDGVSFGAGDAVAANKAMQIIDPWPASSRTVTHGMRGEQAEAAMAKLRRRESGEEAAPPAAAASPGAAPPAAAVSPQSVR
jgi:hypothetical protein